uniref:Uncharacterized protein n=1 Tax=Arundo donax TaxID=35708 RepID=A0A0A8ZAS3_ARUDO
MLELGLNNQFCAKFG